ncbi:unnamed protein product [Closterium sp. NIES-64]|nr:unnamed protein product [Closterium sp. NIES-64]
MIVSDLDNTMVDHKDPNHESLREFASLWQSTFARDSLLVYSTGRSPTLYNQLKSQVPLLTPGAYASLWQSTFARDLLLVYSTGRSPTLHNQLKSQVPLLTPGELIVSRIVGYTCSAAEVSSTALAVPPPFTTDSRAKCLCSRLVSCLLEIYTTFIQPTSNPLPISHLSCHDPPIIITIPPSSSRSPHHHHDPPIIITIPPSSRSPHHHHDPPIIITIPPSSSRSTSIFSRPSSPDIVIKSVDTEIPYGASTSLHVYSPNLLICPLLLIPHIPPLAARHRDHVNIVIMSVGTEITYGASMEPDRGWEDCLGPPSRFFSTHSFHHSPIPTPDIVIMSVGTEITYGASMQPDRGAPWPSLPFHSTRSLPRCPVPSPDIVIMSVGTEITYGASMQPDQGWEEYLNDGWDRAAVVDVAKGFPLLRFQVSLFVSRLKRLDDWGGSLQPDQGVGGASVRWRVNCSRAGSEWEEHLCDGWDRNAVEGVAKGFPQLRFQGSRSLLRRRHRSRWEEQQNDGWERQTVVDVAKGLPQLRFQVCLALSVGVAGAGGRSNRTMGGWERQAVVDVAKGFPQLRFQRDTGWEEYLDDGWDRQAVVEQANETSLGFCQVIFQADSEQRPHKVSFHLEKDQAGNVVEELRGKLQQRGPHKVSFHLEKDQAGNVVEELRSKLAQRGVSFHLEKDQAGNVAEELRSKLVERGFKAKLKAKVIYSGGCDLDILPAAHNSLSFPSLPILSPCVPTMQLKAKVIYSGGYDLDILPERAGKGQAMAYLLRQFTQHSGSSPSLPDAPCLPVTLPLPLKAKVIYSGGYDLDILPERAGKGQAMAYLLRQFTQHSGSAPKHTLACGDSGNDAELFEVEGAYGVIVSGIHTAQPKVGHLLPLRPLQVSNAMEELVEWHRAHHSTDHVFRATKRCAGGIIEAINHFKFDPQ